MKIFSFTTDQDLHLIEFLEVQLYGIKNCLLGTCRAKVM